MTGYSATALLLAGCNSPLNDFSGKQGDSKPNFVLIIGDDISWNDFGTYGHPNIRTPNVDSIAGEGIKFTSAFLTVSSCSPSRASIMTGRYPHNTGAGNLSEPLPAEQVTFPALLKKAGYYTASAGKFHLGDQKLSFDTIVEGNPSGCERWLEVLKQRPKDKPFCLWLASRDAHLPYRKNTVPKPHTPEDAVVPPFLPDVEETRRDLALYYDEIARLDDYLGKVMEELRVQGVDDNTFILFMADNGRPFPRCKTRLYDCGIRTPFIIRWPNRVKKGIICRNLISAVDIAPTIIEVAGLPPSPTFQGRSFVQLLGNPKKSFRDYVFAEHNWHDFQAHERSVRSKRYLYIRNSFPHLPLTPPADVISEASTYQKMQEMWAQKNLMPQQSDCFVAPRSDEELYDLKKDPHSLTNLTKEAKYANVLNSMREILDKWIDKTDDKVPDDPIPDKFDRRTGKRLRR
jgi:arylsulfatase A-like enzyme